MTKLSSLTPEHDDTVYRETPEEPMPQSDWHRTLIGLLIDALLHFYRGTERVYVSGDIFVYYRQRDTSAVVSPDVFVVKGVEQRRRNSYRAWLEGDRLPEFVIEILSGTTGDDDLDSKLARYRDDLNVKEYFVFDPGVRGREPGLQGFRLSRRRYVPIEPVEGRLPSRVTGLHLVTEGDRLRLWNPATGAWVPTEAEAAVAEAARLRRELEELRSRLPPAPSAPHP